MSILYPKTQPPEIRDAKLVFARVLDPLFEVTLVVIHSQQGHQSLWEEHEHCIRVRHWSGIPYHFWIDEGGVIWRCRPSTCEGAHARTYNRTSWGICLGGDCRHHPPTTTQYQSLASLLQYLFLNRWSTCGLCVHRELPRCDTDCPGKHFSWSALAKLLPARIRLARDLWPSLPWRAHEVYSNSPTAKDHHAEEA